MGALVSARRWTTPVGSWTAPDPWAAPTPPPAWIPRPTPPPAVWLGAAAPLGADGSVVDTPEVAVATAAHLAAVDEAVAAAVAASWATPPPATWVPAPTPSWVTPPPAWVAPHSWALGAAPVGADGSVVDTPEVAAAKVAHYAAKHAAAAAAGVW